MKTIISAVAGCAMAAIVCEPQAYAGTFTALHVFAGGMDGSQVSALLYSGHRILGETQFGGGTTCGVATGCGTAFKLDPSTGAETILYRFNDPAGGQFPGGGLVAGAGVIYGTTLSGGPGNHGTIESYNPATGQRAVVANFPGNADAPSHPSGSLAYANGMLYGTSTFGGASFIGTSFKVDVSTGTVSVLHDFLPAGDAFQPPFGVIYLKGSLYGATPNSSVSHGSGGAVFSINASTGAEKILFDFKSGFQGLHGSAPNSSLVSAGSLLFGTTAGGGTGGHGVIYKVNSATGAQTVVHAFTGAADGGAPSSLVYQAGIIYGTTSGGGASGNGTLFRLDPHSGGLTTLYSFTGASDGYAPANLIAGDGSLYGSATVGAVGAGAENVFKFTP